MKSLITLLLFSALALLGCGDSGNVDSDNTGGAMQEQQVYKWRLVTTWPKNLPGVGLVPERIAKLADTMSNGRLRITVYGAGEIVPALGIFDAVSLGNVEMGHGAAYYWKGKVPAAQFFATVPFGLTAQEMNGWLHYGGGLELWEELYANYNLVPFAAGNTGVQMAGWFNREINSLDDLRGLKMRIPGLGGEVLESAGVTAVNLPGGEIFTSLQTGVIDATDWIGPYNDLAFGLHQAANYYYYPGWHEPGPSLELIVNKEAFNSLPPDLKEILRTATRRANEDSLSEYTTRNNSALKELVEEHGVQLRRLPDDVLDELYKISIDRVAEIPGDDPLAQRIYESYRAYYDQVVDYHELTERAYINARAKVIESNP